MLGVARSPLGMSEKLGLMEAEGVQGGAGCGWALRNVLPASEVLTGVSAPSDPITKLARASDSHWLFWGCDRQWAVLNAMGAVGPKDSSPLSCSLRELRLQSSLPPSPPSLQLHWIQACGPRTPSACAPTLRPWKAPQTHC